MRHKCAMFFLPIILLILIIFFNAKIIRNTYKNHKKPKLVWTWALCLVGTDAYTRPILCYRYEFRKDLCRKDSGFWQLHLIQCLTKLDIALFFCQIMILCFHVMPRYVVIDMRWFYAIRMGKNKIFNILLNKKNRWCNV